MSEFVNDDDTVQTVIEDANGSMPYAWKSCDYCNGHGWVYGYRCPCCGGKGHVKQYYAGTGGSDGKIGTR